MKQQRLKRAHNQKVEQNKEKKIELDTNTSSIKIFYPFKLKEIVFLAILSASVLVTSSVMPLVASLVTVIFGIAQLVTGFQMSFFITLALIKVRKPFTLSLVLLFMSVFMVFMSEAMFFSNIFVMLVVETLIIVIFRGYKKDKACFIAGALIPPLSLVIPTAFNSIVAPEVFAVVMGNPFIVLGMLFAVVATGLIGAALGLKMGRELTKAGVLN